MWIVVMLLIKLLIMSRNDGSAHWPIFLDGLSLKKMKIAILLNKFVHSDLKLPKLTPTQVNSKIWGGNELTSNFQNVRYSA